MAAESATLWGLLAAGNLVVWWSVIASFAALRRDDRPRAKQLARRAMFAFLAISVGAVAATAWLVVTAFGASDDAGPTAKARILAQGISEAMSCLAFLGVLTAPAGIGSVVMVMRTR